MPHLRTCSLLWLLGLSGAACGTTPLADGPSVPESAAAPTSTNTRRAPLVLSLDGPEQAPPGEPLVLTARIVRSVALRAPLKGTLVLPAGVTLLEGDLTFELAPNAQPDAQTLRFVIRADETMLEDVTLTLDARGQAFGVHAERSYRFGRKPAPVLAPARSAPLRVGQRNFGRSVDVSGHATGR